MQSGYPWNQSDGDTQWTSGSQYASLYFPAPANINDRVLICSHAPLCDIIIIIIDKDESKTVKRFRPRVSHVSRAIASTGIYLLLFFYPRGSFHAHILGNKWPHVARKDADSLDRDNKPVRAFNSTTKRSGKQKKTASAFPGAEVNGVPIFQFTKSKVSGSKWRSSVRTAA